MEKELIQFVRSAEDGFAIIDQKEIEVVYDFSCVKYRRTNILPDSRFWEWISKEEMGGRAGYQAGRFSSGWWKRCRNLDLRKEIDQQRGI